MDDISKIKTILDLYDNLSYIDLYGTQIVIFIFLTIFEISAIIILTFKRYSQYYKDHWNEYRCNPTIMPFAGFINKPDGVDILSYTQTNYAYCSQTNVDRDTEKLMQPFFETQQQLNKNALGANSNISSLVSSNNETADNTQDALNTGADKLSKIVSLLNYGYTLFTSFFSNITEIMTAMFQFSLTGITWTTMFSKVLVLAFKVILVLFFIGSVVVTMPFWFLIFPLAVFILYVIVMVIGFKFSDYVDIINSSMSKVEPFTLMKPKLSLCFDKKTRIRTLNGYKTIKKIKVGDILKNGEMVTSTFKTIAPPIMFNLNGIIVSGDHYVFKDGWIKVKYHPESIMIRYHKKFLYCLNTTSKKIKIDNHVFMDWDELDKKRKNIVGAYLENCGRKRDDIHSMDKGYPSNLRVKTDRGYKKIYQIEPGEICYGSKILAKVTIKGDDLIEKRHLKLYNVVTDTGYFKNKRDYNFIIDKLFYIS